MSGPANMTVTVTSRDRLPVESVSSCVGELFADGDLVELDARRGCMVVEIVYPA